MDERSRTVAACHPHQEESRSSPSSARCDLTRRAKVWAPLQIQRSFSLYHISNRVVFHNPLEQVCTADQAVAAALGLEDAAADELCCQLRPLGQLLLALKGRLHVGRLHKMVSFHCGSSKKAPGLEPLQKISLVRLFRATYHKIIPAQLLGEHGNGNAFIRNVQLLLTSGKNTPVMTCNLVNGMLVDQVPWLKAASSLCSQTKAAILSRLVVWLTVDVFWALVRAFFHVSDTAAGRNEWHFFLKNRFFCQAHDFLQRWVESKRVLQLNATNEHTLRAQSAHVPEPMRCRFLPKKSSFRLICCKMTSKSWTPDARHSVVRLFLRFLANKFCPEAVDLQGRQFSSRWKAFCGRVRQKPVYLVVGDIADAFGSVRHAKLSQILHEIESKLPSHVFLSRNLGGAASTRAKESFSLSCPTGQTSTAHKVSHLMQKIRTRFTTHVVQFPLGKKLNYWLVRGLVQGDVLSSHLCNIYYGHLTLTHLSAFSAESCGESLLVRAMDDFLFATTDATQARRFEQRLARGFESDYGCRVQPDKLKTNFGDAHTPELTFLGFSIKSGSLVVRPDFSKYHQQNIAYASTMNHPVPGGVGVLEQFIVNKMKFLVTMKLLPLLLDTSLNGWDVVIQNLFEIHYVSALRFHSLVTSLLLRPVRAKVSKSFVQLTVRKCQIRSWAHYAHVCKRQLWQPISRLEFECVFLLAFDRLLTKHASLYAGFTWKRSIALRISRLHLHADQLARIKALTSSAYLRSRTRLIRSHEFQRIDKRA